MIDVLEPSGMVNQNSSDIEAIVVAETTDSMISGTPKIEIAGTTPDWQGNTLLAEGASDQQFQSSY